jgi:osmoprotectant transport system ATP-binding protein
MPSSAPRAAALSAADVSKHFADVAALDHASLDVLDGACVALVGESGSGKTTLLRCFNRLVDPDDGIIRVGGEDVASMDPIALRRRIGYVPQDGGLLPHWTVLRNVELVPRLNGRGNVADRARSALELVGLDPATFGTRWPRELSGGQRQRVAMARALADEPKVLLLDEPFGALDAITRSDVQETFAAVRARLGTTSVIVTHDLHEAVLLATQVAVMRRGRVEQIATPATLLAEPATAYVRTLLERARLTPAASVP